MRKPKEKTTAASAARQSQPPGPLAKLEPLVQEKTRRGLARAQAVSELFRENPQLQFDILAVANPGKENFIAAEIQRSDALRNGRDLKKVIGARGQRQYAAFYQNLGGRFRPGRFYKFGRQIYLCGEPDKTAGLVPLFAVAEKLAASKPGEALEVLCGHWRWPPDARRGVALLLRGRLGAVSARVFRSKWHGLAADDSAAALLYDDKAPIKTTDFSYGFRVLAWRGKYICARCQTETEVRIGKHKMKENFSECICTNCGKVSARKIFHGFCISPERDSGAAPVFLPGIVCPRCECAFVPKLSTGNKYPAVRCPFCAARAIKTTAHCGFLVPNKFFKRRNTAKKKHGKTTRKGI